MLDSKNAVSTLFVFMYAHIHTRAGTSCFKILKCQILPAVYPYFCVWLWYSTRALLLCMLKYFTLLYICGGFIEVHVVIYPTPVVFNICPTRLLFVFRHIFKFCVCFTHTANLRNKLGAYLYHWYWYLDVRRANKPTTAVVVLFQITLYALCTVLRVYSRQYYKIMDCNFNEYVKRSEEPKRSFIILPRFSFRK
jgi:hypothetical protein